MENTAFKVLREDLTALELSGAAGKQYIPNEWNTPDEEGPLTDFHIKGTGLWCSPTLSYARKINRYMLEKHKTKTRIFKCTVGEVLFRTSCRIKTDKVFFRIEDEIHYFYK